MFPRDKQNCFLETTELPNFHIMNKFDYFDFVVTQFIGGNI